jgi:NitT/TauT family transport system substrate-binding protein
MKTGHRLFTLLGIAVLISLAGGPGGAAPAGAAPRAAVAALLAPGGGAVAAPEASAGAPPAQSQLRVGLLPITANLDLFYAREQGYFTEAGISAELTPMAGGAEILPALIGGSLDIGTINSVTHILAADQGFHAKAVASPTVQGRGAPVHAILVRADSPIQSASDLEGRTMATNTLNNIDHVMQQAWVRQRGGDPRRVNFVEVPFPQMAAALAQSRVDAIGPTEPFVTVAQGQGARVLAYHYKDVNDVTLLAYYGATDDWLARNADLARRLQQVAKRANDYLYANPDEQRAAAVRLLNMNPDLASRVGFPDMLTRLDPALLQWWIDTVRSFNLISSSPNPREMIYETVQ